MVIADCSGEWNTPLASIQPGWKYIHPAQPATTGVRGSDFNPHKLMGILWLTRVWVL